MTWLRYTHAAANEYKRSAAYVPRALTTADGYARMEAGGTLATTDLNILVLHEQPADREVLVNSLQELGAKSIAAAGGAREGLQMLKTAKPAIDVVIMD